MNQQCFLKIIFFITLIVFALAITGCKKDEQPPTSHQDLVVPKELFPLITGRVIEYSGYLTQGDSENKIPGTEDGYSTKWEVTQSIPCSLIFPPAIFPNLANESAVLIHDTTKIPAVGIIKYTPIFIRYDSTTGDYSYLINIGYLYRTAKIWKSTTDSSIRADSLRFITLAKPRTGIGAKFTCFDENFTSYLYGVNNTIPINLKIEGIFEGKESITIDTVNYTTYRLVISRKVYSGSNLLSQGPIAKLWLVENVGPIQMLLFGDAESNGNFRKMVRKNF